MFKVFKLLGWLLAAVAIAVFAAYLIKLKPDNRRPATDFAPATAAGN